jgi:hypothetical protein
MINEGTHSAIGIELPNRHKVKDDECHHMPQHVKDTVLE